MSTEKFQEILAARQYLYRVFQSLFGESPSADILGNIDPELVDESFAILFGGEVPEPAAKLRQLLGNTANLDFDAVKTNYTKLFIGIDDPLARPWESVHLSHEHRLFTRETLAVRKMYAAQGVRCELYPHVADDHIALELGFLQYLGMRALESDTPECARYLEASLAFVQEHLGKWIGIFASRISAYSKDSLYALASDAACLLVDWDRTNLPEIIAEMVEVV